MRKGLLPDFPAVSNELLVFGSCQDSVALISDRGSLSPIDVLCAGPSDILAWPTSSKEELIY